MGPAHSYALTSTEINDFLGSWNSNSLYDVMHISLSMYDLNGGYEQLYIAQGDVQSPNAPTPEPASMLLMSTGLGGVVFMRKRLKGSGV